MSVYAGLDIGAYTVDVVTRQADKAAKAKRYKQTPEGHNALIAHLKKAKPALIVMEATGVYYFDLAVALADADLPLAVINPKGFRHFAELKLRTSKTDAIDSDLLAEYGQRMAPALQRGYRHLLAAKGVGEATCLSILAELCVLPASLKSGQISRHAGLDVRQHQSGTSVNRPARISKAGNVYLRAALYMPALSAVRYDPHARAFYETLVARGKKIQALVAVMRKYLTGLWACLKTDTPFDSARLFQTVGLQTP